MDVRTARWRPRGDCRCLAGFQTGATPRAGFHRSTEARSTEAGPQKQVAFYQIGLKRRWLSRSPPSRQRDVQDEDSVVRYHLFSAPWAVLRYYAEDLHLKLPLQELPNQASNWAASLLEWLGFPNILLEGVPDVPHKSYSCQFKVSNLSRFLGSENQATFLPITYRHQILFEVLAKTLYGHERKRLFGIDQLLGEGVFSAAFPQHDGPRALGLTQRQVRLQPWAHWHKWHKYQLLDHVRRYLREKVAFYFAWLSESRAGWCQRRGAGTLVSLVGCLMVPAPCLLRWVCSKRDPQSQARVNLTPPPQAGRLFDHGGTVLGLFALRGPQGGSPPTEPAPRERPRPQSAASAPTAAVNPAAGESEPCLPKRSRLRRAAGSTVVTVMVAVEVMCLGSIVLYRAIMAILLSRSDNTLLAASRVSSLTGSMVNLVFILNLSKIYMALAHVLTTGARCAAQTHRTQTKFEDAFALNVFIFQFVNFYSSPIHIAFFKGRFVGYPGNYHTSPGVRSQECAAGGCLTELAQELLVITVGKQIICNVQEFLVPRLSGRWQRSRLCSKERKAGLARCPGRQADYELLPFQGPFDGHLEMVLQSGFITVFVAACLLAPLFALLNNRVEIRLHARKFVRERRRPVAERAQGIGICFHILAGITRLAVISNAFLLAFSSDFLPRAYYQWSRARNLRGFVNFTLARAPPAFAAAHNRTSPCLLQVSGFRGDDGHHARTYWNLLAIHLAFIIVCEHVVFSIGRVLDLLVPDIPGSVEIKVKREYYLAKQALAEDEVSAPAPGDQPSGSEMNLGPQA
uniref:Anoctamin n=1 Tax=Monodon monoceros TaxID=40151 RepID=A0A8C6B1B6_MONMO